MEAVISFLLNLFGDVLKYFYNKFKPKDKVEILKLRQHWKSQFIANIPNIDNSFEYLGEVIIRNVSRMDEYPDANDKGKGISPWFKVGLIGLYFRGIEVGLRYEYLRHIDATGWVFGETKNNSITVVLIGRIPFELIKSVDWDGDEYYNFPHIYCEFSKDKKQPYEQLLYCTEEKIDENRTLYTEISMFEDVKKLSDKMNIKRRY